jgi:hypothetical protein
MAALFDLGGWLGLLPVVQTPIGALAVANTEIGGT